MSFRAAIKKQTAAQHVRVDTAMSTPDITQPDRPNAPCLRWRSSTGAGLDHQRVADVVKKPFTADSLLSEVHTALRNTA